MNKNEIIGRNLKALREANSLTRTQVASYLNIQRSAYARYERGGMEVPVEVLEKAGNLFGCGLDIFFEEDEDTFKEMSVCAFRTGALNDEDVKEVAAFKEIVMNYMRMDKLLSQGKRLTGIVI